jgi:hypothetical protein
MQHHVFNTEPAVFFFRKLHLVALRCEHRCILEHGIITKEISKTMVLHFSAPRNANLIC